MCNGNRRENEHRRKQVIRKEKKRGAYNCALKKKKQANNRNEEGKAERKKEKVVNTQKGEQHAWQYRSEVPHAPQLFGFYKAHLPTAFIRTPPLKEKQKTRKTTAIQL